MVAHSVPQHLFFAFVADDDAVKLPWGTFLEYCFDFVEDLVRDVGLRIKLLTVLRVLWIQLEVLVDYRDVVL